MRTMQVAATAMLLCTAGDATPAGARQDADPEAAAQWRRRGLALGYNLDHADALAAFQRAIEADPTSPTSYRLLAATIWNLLLFEQGAITVDDFLGEARKEYRRSPPRAELADAARVALDRAIVLAEEQLQERPDDPLAHYHVGAAYGVRAAYIATVEGRLFGSLGSARRAYREHARVLALDPSRKDAGLIVGAYRFTVASLPAPMRLGAILAGLRGGREQGLRLVEAAAGHPGEAQPNAQLALVLMLNRAGRYDDALQVIRALQRQFPRNRLLWIEEAGTALRAGRAGEARTAVETGLARLAADPRPRAPGEEARWRYTHGAALGALRLTAPAASALRAALSLATHDWLRGRIHVELGKLADLAADRTTARNEYREALRLCREDDDAACAKEADSLAKRGHR